MSDQKNGNAVEEESGLKWESSPFSPDNAQRARKDTVAIPTKKLRSMLKDAEDVSAFAKNWLSPGESSASEAENSAVVSKLKVGSSAPMERVGADIADGRLPALVGFLVSYDRSPAGEAYALRVGRWVVSSVALGLPSTTMVIEDRSVGAVHATLSVSAEGAVRLQDHFSDSGTGVTRSNDKEEEAINDSVVVLEHGNLIRFGKRTFRLCLVPK